MVGGKKKEVLTEEDCLSTICDVMDQAQGSSKSSVHLRLSEKLQQLFHKCEESGQGEKKIFIECFLRVIAKFFESYEPNKHVDNCSQFVSTFAVDTSSIDIQNLTAADLSDISFRAVYPISRCIFSFFNSFHKHPEKGFRYRLCSLVRDVLKKLADVNAEVDDNIMEELSEAFLERTRDKIVKIRMVAVESLSTFQNMDDDECPVIKAFISLLADGSADVREAALKDISVTLHTLKAIKERCRDVSAAVRRIAYEKMARLVSIKSIKIHERISMLKYGLTDESQEVRNACERELLPEWLKSSGGKIEFLLEKLHVDVNDENENVIRDVLHALFRQSNSIDDVVEGFTVLNGNKLMEEPTAPKVCYWHYLVDYVNENARNEAEKQKLLDQLVPSLFQLSQYVYRYVIEHPPAMEEQDISTLENKAIEEEYISKHLLRLLPFADDSDAAGNNNLRLILENLIGDKNVNNSLIEILVEMFVEWHASSNTTDTAVQTICELISGLRESDTTGDATLFPATPGETGAAEETIFPADLTLAPKQDETEMADMTMKQKLADSVDDMNPMLLSKILTISCALLKLKVVNRLNEILKTLLDVLIIPCVKHRRSDIRNLAFRALAMSCLIEESLAKRHIFLFFTSFKLMDQETVQMTSLAAIFDLLLIHGMQILCVDQQPEEGGGSPKEVSEREAEREKWRTLKDATDTALTEFLEILDGENTNLQFAVGEGLAKLLLHQRIYAPKVISRLCLIWFNEVYAANTKLNHCLGVFFPKFAFASCRNQEALEEGFLDIMNTLFDAPTTSPLWTIDRWQVASFLVYLTQSTKLTPKAGVHEDGSVHGTLAMTLCNDILEQPESDKARLFCRLLPDLELGKLTEPCLKDLLKLLKSIMKIIRQKQTRNFLEKALIRVKDTLKELDPESKDDEEEEQCSVEANEDSVTLDTLTLSGPVSVDSTTNEEKEKPEKKKRGLQKRGGGATTLKTPSVTTRSRIKSEGSALNTPMRRSSRIQLKSEDLTVVPEAVVSDIDE